MGRSAVGEVDPGGEAEPVLKTTFDKTSIMATIEQGFGAAAVATRDASVFDLSSTLTAAGVSLPYSPALRAGHRSRGGSPGRRRPRQDQSDRSGVIPLDLEYENGSHERFRGRPSPGLGAPPEPRPGLLATGAAIRLVTEGKTYQQVADQMGFSNRGPVHRLVRTALENETVGSVSELRRSRVTASTPCCAACGIGRSLGTSTPSG